jgi:hypothetical protein
MKQDTAASALTTPTSRLLTARPAARQLSPAPVVAIERLDKHAAISQVRRSEPGSTTAGVLSEHTHGRLGR